MWRMKILYKLSKDSKCVCKQIIQGDDFMDKDINEKMRQEDLDMMKNPGKWYQYPILPVKRVKKSENVPEFGLLLPIKNPVVYLVNMWDLRDLGIRSSADIMNKVKPIAYKSFEAILDDGWVVDQGTEIYRSRDKIGYMGI